MKKLYLLMIACICCLQLSAQKENNSEMKQMRDDGAYFFVDVMPEFPGGSDALSKYLGDNIKYPEEAKEHQISGRVLVQFVVEPNGKITRQQVINKAHPLLDAEALRVLFQMPAWKPGELKGKKVPVIYNVPITFNLPGSDLKEMMKSILIPGKKPAQTPSFEGIWQRCIYAQPVEGNQYKISILPIFKTFTKDKFSTLVIGGGDQLSFINVAGSYDPLGADNTYTEHIENAATEPEIIGRSVVLKVEFLSENLMKATFQIPGIPRTFTEYWVRVLQERPHTLL